MSVTNKKRKATHVRHGITLPAKIPYTALRSLLSVALSSVMAKSIFSIPHKTSLLSMYNYAVEGVQFVPTALFNQSRRRSSKGTCSTIYPSQVSRTLSVIIRDSLFDTSIVVLCLDNLKNFPKNIILHHRI